jgi:ABC-type branched-subunit amino acid transport system permease subunit
VESQGISPTPYKLAAFVIAGVITGMAGGIYAFHLKIIDPSFLDFYYMQTFLIIVIIGGAGSFWAVVMAGAAMVVLPEALRFSNELRMVIYGVVLVAVMMLMPQGIAGWLEARRVALIRKALRGARCFRSAACAKASAASAPCRMPRSTSRPVRSPA